MAVKNLAGPQFIAATAGNLYVPSSALIYGVVNQIDITNVTGGDVSAILYIGATGGSAAGTEFYEVTVPANTTIPKYYSPGRKLTSTQFLTGIASAATSLTIDIMGSEEVV